MIVCLFQFSLMAAISAAFVGCGGSESSTAQTAPATATSTSAKPPAVPAKTSTGASAKKAGGANKVDPNADVDPRERRKKAAQ